VTLVNTFGAGSTSRVMRFRVGARVAEDSRVPERLVEVPPPGRPTTTRTMRFQQRGLHGMPGWTVNGEPFAPDRLHATVPLGAVEIWRLVSDLHHPVHLHLARFQVVSRGIRGPGRYDGGWKDTVDLRPAEEVAVVARFDGYPGRYVVHCHNLEHEDMAMMGNFLVR
jgi:spore coat protein A